MVAEFSTFGSCSSRNIFNSKINEDYKNFFHINESIESVTLISLMSKPIEYEYKLINSSHPYDNKCVRADFSKDYLNFLKETHIDYLIIDTYFDVVYSIFILDNESVISNSNRLRHTDIYNNLDYVKKLSIVKNFKEYMDLWTFACNKFFNFMNTYCEDTRIILNCSRSVYKYSENGNIVENENLKKKSIINKYRDILDSYILEHFDVEVLPFDENTLADKNHIFGFHQTHYENKYYSEKKRQLNDIIEKNLIMSYENKFNKELRYLKRKNLINEFISNTVELNDSYSPTVHMDKLIKYYTARIDLKNRGVSTNDIEILEISDKDSKIAKPKWFKDETGTGTEIQSKQLNLHLKIKCINDGKMLIRLRGMNFKDNQGKRLPIFIKYTKFIINNENIINSPVIVHHDDSFNYRNEVKNSEILDIYVEWDVI